MSKTRLIVNADDLGSGSAMDRGIFRAFRDGIVTSASLLANGPSFAEAAREALAAGLAVGVHLNLSEGRPLSGEVRGLTTASGEFPGKVKSRRRLLQGAVDSQDIRAEFTAQIRRVFDAGLRPDHLDTHQHVILFPEVTQTALEIARRFGIAAARLPQPAEPAGNDPQDTLGEELALYRRLAPPASRAFAAAGIVSPDGLWGMPFLDRLDERALGAILHDLPHGTWELMVHPGGHDPSHPFATPARETETAALTSPAIRALVGELGLALTTFGGLACAS